MATFSELNEKFTALYDRQAYAEALALVQASGPAFPERHTELITWELCMQSRLGRTADAIRTLSAALETGSYWWTPAALHADPDLAALQGNPEYERLVSICETRWQAASQNSRPERLVFAPQTGAAKLPLLISLHGWGANAGMEAPHWQGLASQGWLVAVLRSSQIRADGLYTWDDLDCTVREAKAHYRALCRDYPVDRRRIVLAGFSQGGGRALWLSLTRAIPARGFLGVGPYLDELDSPAPALPPARRSNLRAYLVSGSREDDEGMFARIASLCAARRIPFHQEVIRGIGHAYPPDFDPIIKRAFAFIFEK